MLQRFFGRRVEAVDDDIGQLVDRVALFHQAGEYFSRLAVFQQRTVVAARCPPHQCIDIGAQPYGYSLGGDALAGFGVQERAAAGCQDNRRAVEQAGNNAPFAVAKARAARRRPIDVFPAPIRPTMTMDSFGVFGTLGVPSWPLLSSVVCSDSVIRCYCITVALPWRLLRRLPWNRHVCKLSQRRYICRASHHRQAAARRRRNRTAG